MRDARERELVPDTLLLLEHDPVYTRGRRTAPGELPMGEDWYAERGIEIVEVDRGGRVTYHGPGQLVGYPIVRTADVRRARARDGAAMIAARSPRRASPPRPRRRRARLHRRLGRRRRARSARSACTCARGVTTHGFAINVDNDLEPFEWIVPCGLDGVRDDLASRARPGATGRSLPCVRRRVAYALRDRARAAPAARHADARSSASWPLRRRR